LLLDLRGAELSSSEWLWILEESIARWGQDDYPYLLQALRLAKGFDLDIVTATDLQDLIALTTERLDSPSILLGGDAADGTAPQL